MVRRAVIAIVGSILLAGCGQADPGPGSARPPTPTAGEEGAVTAGGGAAMCVEGFSERALGRRDWALDGVVSSVGSPATPDGPFVVEIDVRRWFRGGDAATATVKTYDVSGQTLVGGPPLKVGERILASGDDEYLWGCGFSMPYSARDAEVFERAFA
jgi:hypothetical protein